MIKQCGITVKTGSATLVYAEMGDIIVNSASAMTITLPTPSPGLWYRVGNIGAGVVTLAYSSTLTTISQYGQILLLANGTSGYYWTKGGQDITKSVIEQVLTGVISSHSHNMALGDLTDFPDYGSGYAGRVLAVKADGTGLEYVSTGEAANGIPAGGALNQLLAKNSATDFDCKWLDAPSAVNGLPSGGTAGQVLTKNSATDYDAAWAASAGGGGISLVSTLPSSPTNGQTVLILLNSVLHLATYLSSPGTWYKAPLIDYTLPWGTHYTPAMLMDLLLGDATKTLVSVTVSTDFVTALRITGATSATKTLTWTFNSAAGKFEIWYGYETENGYDYAYIYIDDVAISAKLQGTTVAAYLTSTLTAGSHTLKITYTKDGSGNVGYDGIQIYTVSIPQ